MTNMTRIAWTCTLLAVMVVAPARAAGPTNQEERCGWFSDSTLDVCQVTSPAGLDYRHVGSACGVASVIARERCMTPEVWRELMAAQKKPDKADFVAFVARHAGEATAAGCDKMLDLMADKPSCSEWGARARRTLQEGLTKELDGRKAKKAP
jgi:hypothetical protein